jgi:ubiquitin C-terminal hydrolase
MTEKTAEDKPDLSLESSLRLFLKEEKLGEDNTWFCPQCKEDRQALKKFDLWRLPEVLIIHLKRFSYSSYSRDKIDSFVDFPLT